MTSVLQQASEFVSWGIAIFPVRYRDKRPAVSSWEYYKTSLPSPGDLVKWFPSNLRNYAVCLGWQRLAVLDFDDMQAWYEWQMWSVDNCHLLDNAYRVKTARGVHLYFSLMEDCHNLKLPGIDFKACGYVVGPGSTHPSGHVYRALNAFCLPIVEKLSDVLPAEIYELATDAQEIKPVRTPGESACTLPGSLSIWDEAEQGMLFDDLSPVEKIKRRWRLEHFFPGEKPDHAGFLHVCCPFHKDTEPSAWVDTQKQLFGCFSCNFKPMTVIGFYSALHQIEIKSAIREMLK